MTPVVPAETAAKILAAAGWTAGDLAAALGGPELLTVPQVAQRLGVSVRTVYARVTAGDLTVVKVGRSTRVPVAQVAKLVG